MNQYSHAAEALTQTTVSIYADGKSVAGLMLPIGAKVELSAVANHIDENADNIRFTGNVQGRFTPPAGQSVILCERRRSIGLEPLADYARRFGLTYVKKID